MKKNIFLFLILWALIMLSCNKQPASEYHCYIPVCYCAPLGVAFVGFNPADLDTVICFRYEGGTNMANLIGRDTFIHTPADFLQKGDTTFLTAAASSSNYFFWQLDPDVDYRVVLPGFQTNYDVTGSTLGPPADSFISNSPCQVHGTPVEPLVNTHVDGQLAQPFKTILTNIQYHFSFL